MKMAVTKKTSSMQVIARAGAILKALEQYRSGLSYSDLARITQLPKTTVYRLTSALQEEKLVIAGADGVRLGPALIRMAGYAPTEVLSLARGPMEKLGRHTRETVDFCVLRGNHSISVDQFPSDHELRVISPVGTAFPCHCTANGKAMLAALSDEAICSLWPQDPPVRTDYTLRTVEAIIKDARMNRQLGYALERQEHALGVAGLGVVIEVGVREQYAISLAVPLIRFDQNFDFLLSLLLQCKAEMESIFSEG